MAMVPIARRIPYPDGTALLERPVALAAFAREHGTVLLRGVLDRDRMLALRWQLLELCREHGWMIPGTPLMEGRSAPGMVVREGAGEPWYAWYRAVQRLREFHALAHSPGLLAAVAAIVGGEPLVHPRHIARCIGPGTASYTTPPHQDFWYINGTPDTWTAWVPLDDVSEELGGLAIQPGSHRRGRLAMRPADGAGGHGIADVLDEAWAWEPVRAGDVLLFHSHTVHQGVDNRTDRIRLSLDLRFQALGEPVDPSSLQPHMHALDWDGVYQDWAADDPLRRYWEPQLARVAPLAAAAR